MRDAYRFDLDTAPAALPSPEARHKEVGVCKVPGATAGRIVGLVARDVLRPGAVRRGRRSRRVRGVVTTCWHAVRIAHLRPVDVLRYE